MLAKGVDFRPDGAKTLLKGFQDLVVSSKIRRLISDLFNSISQVAKAFVQCIEDICCPGMGSKEFMPDPLDSL